MIKWPVEKEPATIVADVKEPDQDHAEEPQTRTEVGDSSRLKTSGAQGEGNES